MNNPIVFDSASLVSLAWIALLIVVVIVIPLTVIGCIAFNRAPVSNTQNPAYTFSKLFDRAKTLQMMTVILIIVSATFLALCHIIDSYGIVGILSGVAGFVLGGLQQKPRQIKEEKPSNPQMTPNQSPKLTKEVPPR